MSEDAPVGVVDREIDEELVTAAFELLGPPLSAVATIEHDASPPEWAPSR